MCQQILWNFKQTLPIICWWQNNAVLWQRPLSECYLPVWSGQQHNFFLDRTRIAFFLVKLLGTRFCINHGYWVTCIKVDCLTGCWFVSSTFKPELLKPLYIATPDVYSGQRPPTISGSGMYKDRVARRATKILESQTKEPAETMKTVNISCAAKFCNNGPSGLVFFGCLHFTPIILETKEFTETIHFKSHSWCLFVTKWRGIWKKFG